MDKKSGIYADFAPTTRQELFETVKNKTIKCTNWTQLCAAIYPYILYVVCEYMDKSYTITITQWQRAVGSFREDLYSFRQALSKYVSAAIPLVVSPAGRLSDFECLRNDILDAVIETAVEIAKIEASHSCVQPSAVMARFVEDL